MSEPQTADLSEDRLRALRTGLVGRQHQYRYNTDPTFKASIDMLTKMLPYWVEGIAAQVDAEAEHMAHLHQKLLSDALRPRVIDPDDLKGFRP